MDPHEYALTIDPALDPTKAHTAVLCVDSSPYIITFTSGADLHTALAEALRATGLGAEVVGDTVRLSPGYTATWSVTPPTPLAGKPNRAQRRLRPGKRPPDTSAVSRHPAWRGGR